MSEVRKMIDAAMPMWRLAKQLVAGVRSEKYA